MPRKFRSEDCLNLYTDSDLCCMLDKAGPSKFQRKIIGMRLSDLQYLGHPFPCYKCFKIYVCVTVVVYKMDRRSTILCFSSLIASVMYQ